MTDAERAAALSQAADDIASSISDAVGEAFQEIRDGADTAAAAQPIASGMAPAAAEAALPTALLTAAITGVTHAVTRAVQAGGDAAAAIAGRVDGLVVRFDVTNPGTVRWLQTWELRLLRGFVAETRAAATEAVRAGVLAGKNPKDIARDIPRSIGLTARMEQAAQNYEAALREGRMADAASYKLRDKRFGHGAQPGEERIAQMVARYRERALKMRQETIARTEAIRAANAGNFLLWEQQVADGRVEQARVRRKWVYTADSKVRHSHRTIPGMNPNGVGLREPFKSELGPIMYPGDPDAPPALTVNCRCTTITRILPRPRP